MLRQINQQLLDLAFSELEIGLAIFDLEGTLQTSNGTYDQLCNRLRPGQQATFPFADEVLSELRQNLARTGHYRHTLTLDPLGRPTSNVFLGDVYSLRAQTISDEQGTAVGWALRVEESSEDVRKGEMLDEFLVHRGLILDNTFSGLVYLSPQFEVMWKRLRNLWDDQFDHKYIEGTHCYESYGRTTPCGDCPILKSMKSGKVEKELRSMDDGTFIESIVIPVEKDGGEPEGYILHLSDVTERETMVEALRMAKASVIENERIEEAFINNMNHEIRTPLNAIIGFNDILNGVAGEHMEEEEKRMMKDHISKNADRLITLINDILDLSKMETGKLRIRKTVCSLREICYNARESVKPMVQLGVQLKHEYPTALVDTMLYTDGKRVEQLLRNFLSNACKHTRKGTITLCVKTFEDEQRQPRLEFSVVDTGEGIPEDKVQELFTPFRKLHGPTQGLGMGLAICKQIAKMLGGHVYLDHLYNSGTRFVFEMPMEKMP